MNRYKLALVPLALLAAFSTRAADVEPSPPPGAPDDEPREYYPVVPVTQERWFKHEPPPGPPAVTLGGKTYRLPAINRSYWGLSYEVVGDVPYEDELAAAAPGFDVKGSDGKGLALDGRTRLARYLYLAGRAAYTKGDVTYESGAQKAKYDYRNLYSQGVAGVVFDIHPLVNIDLYGGYGAYDFKVKEGVAKVSDGGWVYGGNLTALFKGGFEGSLGYQTVSTGNSATDKAYEEEVVARLSIPLGNSLKLVTRYASGMGRFDAGLAWQFSPD